MNFDSVTISPYMGQDSVLPYLEFKDKWAIVLALTSNKSSSDFQIIEGKNGEKLFEKVLKISKYWGSEKNMMYVVGQRNLNKFPKLEELYQIIFC